MIFKGGEGSGVKGHVTQDTKGGQYHKLNDKLVQMNPMKSQLNKLTRGAVLEGKETQSGKPIFNETSSATAHGYTPEDFRDAGNAHYDMAQKMYDQIDRVKAMGNEVPEDMKEIVKFHERQFKANFGAANRLDTRMRNTDAKLKEQSKKMAEDAKSVKKSGVHMGQQDSALIETAHFALENKLAQENEAFDRILNVMEGFQYGDEPRTVIFPKGDLILTKVDDGLYSGFFRKVQPNGLEENAKIRIERITIPSMVEFLIAKEYISNPPPVIETLTAKMDPDSQTLTAPVLGDVHKDSGEPMPPEDMTLSADSVAPQASASSPLALKVRMLELISKLLNPL